MTTLAINGFAAEATVQRLAKAALLKPLTFDTLHLIRTAHQSSIGRKRLKSARPYLVSEYGRPAPYGNYAVEWRNGIDKAAVIKVNPHATPETLIQSLRRIIQGETSIS